VRIAAAESLFHHNRLVFEMPFHPEVEPLSIWNAKWVDAARSLRHPMRSRTSLRHDFLRDQTRM
jgi:hypothetical protein